MYNLTYTPVKSSLKLLSWLNLSLFSVCEYNSAFGTERWRRRSKITDCYLSCYLQPWPRVYSVTSVISTQWKVRRRQLSVFPPRGCVSYLVSISSKFPISCLFLSQMYLCTYITNQWRLGGQLIIRGESGHWLCTKTLPLCKG